MTGSIFEIVIVGGGIAGLSAAIALRAPGRSIIVLETTLMNKEIGAAISLQPNASRILSSWGILDEIVAFGGSPDQGMKIYRTDGHLQAQIPFKFSDYAADRLLFHRVDLHDALKALATDPTRAGPPAIIRTGVKAVSCDCEAGAVTLASGETVTGDLIVAADGIHSKLRASVIGKQVTAIPTGFSAYRMIIPRENLIEIPQAIAQMDAEKPWTTLLMGHSCRAIMGPCRNAELLSIVALVPDELMHEETGGSWTSSGSLEKCLQSFQEFPEWLLNTFKAAPDLGLWQLRDIDPLDNWTKGRTILIGDAAHAMLPTQGQGASQSIEDAEALGAFFQDVVGTPNPAQINKILQEVFNARYDRATLIQGFSRQQARPATEKGDTIIKLDVHQFMKYNCDYQGAKDWAERMADGKAGP